MRDAVEVLERERALLRDHADAAAYDAVLRHLHALALLVRDGHMAAAAADVAAREGTAVPRGAAAAARAAPYSVAHRPFALFAAVSRQTNVGGDARDAILAAAVAVEAARDLAASESVPRRDVLLGALCQLCLMAGDRAKAEAAVQAARAAHPRDAAVAAVALHYAADTDADAPTLRSLAVELVRLNPRSEAAAAVLAALADAADVLPGAHAQGSEGEAAAHASDDAVVDALLTALDADPGCVPMWKALAVTAQRREGRRTAAGAPLPPLPGDWAGRSALWGATHFASAPVTGDSLAPGGADLIVYKATVALLLFADDARAVEFGRASLEVAGQAAAGAH